MAFEMAKGKIMFTSCLFALLVNTNHIDPLRRGRCIEFQQPMLTGTEHQFKSRALPRTAFHEW